MKYLVKYKLFESKLESEPSIDEVRSRIFRFYAAIPTVRSKSSLVIQKIITEYGISYDIFKDKTIDLKSIGGSEDTKENKHVKLRNSLRFQDYILKLLGETDNTEDDSSDKATRGFDFEGLIAGFFGGKFSNNPSSTYDIENNDKKFSIKFSEDKDIVLTNIKKIIDKLKEPENKKDKECLDIIRNYKLLEVLYADNTKLTTKNGLTRSENFKKLEKKDKPKQYVDGLINKLNQYGEFQYKISNTECKIIFKKDDYFNIKFDTSNNTLTITNTEPDVSKINGLKGKIIEKLKPLNKYNISFSDFTDYVKKILEDEVFNDVDYFVVGKPNDKSSITIYVIKKDDVISHIINKGLRASKNKGYNQLRIDYEIFKDAINTIEIKAPDLTDEDILKIYKGENRDWANEIFDEWSDRLRTDFIDHLYNNRDRICKKIEDFDKLNKKNLL